MGEVYRARDTRLDREVAIKVLPEHFAGDDERPDWSALPASTPAHVRALPRQELSNSPAGHGGGSHRFGGSGRRAAPTRRLIEERGVCVPRFQASQAFIDFLLIDGDRDGANRALQAHRRRRRKRQPPAGETPLLLLEPWTRPR